MRGYMTINLRAPFGFVELTGPNVAVFSNECAPVYDGSIDDAPEHVIQWLLDEGAIKAT